MGSVYNHSIPDATESITTSSRRPTPTSSPHIPPPPVMPAFLAASNDVTPSADVLNDSPLNDHQYYVPYAHDIPPVTTTHTVRGHPLSDLRAQSLQPPPNPLNGTPDPQSFDYPHVTQPVSNEYASTHLPHTAHFETSNRSSSSSSLAHQQGINIAAHGAQEHHTSSAPSAKALGKRKVIGTNATGAALRVIHLHPAHNQVQKTTSSLAPAAPTAMIYHQTPMILISLWMATVVIPMLPGPGP